VTKTGLNAGVGVNVCDECKLFAKVKWEIYICMINIVHVRCMYDITIRVRPYSVENFIKQGNLWRLEI